MIRGFSLVFLLLISDRRNLLRDSRRDTEQNVPWCCISSQWYTESETVVCIQVLCQYLLSVI